jgi:hypothetical protein
MPPLGGANEWLNAEPLGPAGRVVLIDFRAVPEELEALR